VNGALLLALLSAGPVLPDAAPGQSVRVAWDAQNRACTAAVGTIETGDPDSDAGQAALLRALPDKQIRVAVRGIDATPYRCVSAVVDALQTAGYRGVTLGSPSPVVHR
jgi:biopolymer transport protein ExbD